MIPSVLVLAQTMLLSKQNEKLDEQTALLRKQNVIFGVQVGAQIEPRIANANRAVRRLSALRAAAALGVERAPKTLKVFSWKTGRFEVVPSFELGQSCDEPTPDFLEAILREPLKSNVAAAPCDTNFDDLFEGLSKTKEKSQPEQAATLIALHRASAFYSKISMGFRNALGDRGSPLSNSEAVDPVEILRSATTACSADALLTKKLEYSLDEFQRNAGAMSHISMLTVEAFRGKPMPIISADARASRDVLSIAVLTFGSESDPESVGVLLKGLESRQRELIADLKTVIASCEDLSSSLEQMLDHTRQPSGLSGSAH